MKTTTSERCRNIVVRAAAGESIPDALLDVLREERVTAGWLRGSGVLADVELRAFRADLEGLAPARILSGAVHVLSLEGSIGIASGEPSLGLRAVLARETDRGLETLAGELVSARVLGFEALVTALDDIALGRAPDRTAGVVLIEGERASPTAPREPDRDAGRDAGREMVRESARVPAQDPVRETRETPRPLAAGWAEAVEASVAEEETRPQMRMPGAGPRAAQLPVPPRPARPSASLDDAVFPEAGDVVEHFAFGRCDVLKSDGDRLHLKVGKDGRIREIALEMLRVTELESSGTHRRFKLERKL